MASPCRPSPTLWAPWGGLSICSRRRRGHEEEREMGSDERLPVVHEPVGESLESQALVPIQPAAPALPAEPDRYQGIASKAFSAKQQKLLLAPTPPDVVEFKPSARGGPPRIGSVPQVAYRRRPTGAFGAGGWGLRP